MATHSVVLYGNRQSHCSIVLILNLVTGSKQKYEYSCDKEIYVRTSSNLVHKRKYIVIVVLDKLRAVA